MKTDAEIDKLEKQIIDGLSVPADNSVWQAVNRALDYEIEVATVQALGPDQCNETRQYNAGAAARLRDFKLFLKDKWDKAHVK